MKRVPKTAINDSDWFGNIINILLDNIIVVLIIMAVIILLLLVSQSLFKSTKYGIFVQQKITSNSLMSLSAILLVVGLSTIFVRDLGDELTLLAWGMIINSVVVIFTTTHNSIQSKKSLHQQIAITQLGFMPCLDLFKSQKSSIISSGSRIVTTSSVIHQRFAFKCVSEHPAFNVSWFSWRNAINPYTHESYESNKLKLSTTTHTAIKGRVYGIGLSLEIINEEQILVAEYQSLDGSLYTQMFFLKLNKNLNAFEIDRIDPPFPFPTIRKKKIKTQEVIK